MSNKGSSSDSSNPRTNRTDLLQPDFTPHTPVQRLGEDIVHGPALQDHIVIILGVGPGLGVNIANVFAARGYTTAILSRSKQRLEDWADELHRTALNFREANNIPIGAAPDERLSGAFTCNGLDNASITNAVQEVCDRWPGKKIESGLRAMCQSIAREYGPKLIHVSHVIVDGLIESVTALNFLGMPEGSRFPDGMALLPSHMAKTWLFLAQQHPSAWTFEMDLRPAREHW